MIMAPYYVAAKNLSTRQMSVMSTEGFYIVYDDNSYEDFQPGNITDFVEKSHYGRIQGEWMLLYYIIGMEETDSAVNDRIQMASGPNKIRNSSRLSSGVTKIALKDMRRRAERLAAKEDKPSEVKKIRAKVAATTQERILKDYQKDSKRDDDTLVQEQSEMNLLESRGTAKNAEEFPPCTGNCILFNYIREDLAASKDREEKLMKKVAELEATIKAMNADGPRRTTGNAGEDKKERKDGSTVPLPSGQACPHGEIHIGDGKTIPLQSIMEDVELKSLNLRPRVKALLLLAFPDDCHLRCLDPKLITDGILITPTNLLVFTYLLRQMSWPPGISPPTYESVQVAIRKETFIIRADRKQKNLSEAEKVAAEEKKKKLREAAAQRRKEKKLQEKLLKKDAQKKKHEDNGKAGNGTKKRKLVKPMEESDASGCDSDDQEGEGRAKNPIGDSDISANSPAFPEETDSEEGAK